MGFRPEKEVIARVRRSCCTEQIDVSYTVVIYIFFSILCMLISTLELIMSAVEYHHQGVLGTPMLWICRGPVLSCVKTDVRLEHSFSAFFFQLYQVHHSRIQMFCDLSNRIHSMFGKIQCRSLHAQFRQTSQLEKDVIKCRQISRGFSQNSAAHQIPKHNSRSSRRIPAP